MGQGFWRQQNAVYASHSLFHVSCRGDLQTGKTITPRSLALKDAACPIRRVKPPAINWAGAKGCCEDASDSYNFIFEWISSREKRGRTSTLLSQFIRTENKHDVSLRHRVDLRDLRVRASAPYLHEGIPDGRSPVFCSFRPVRPKAKAFHTVGAKLPSDMDP